MHFALCASAALENKSYIDILSEPSQQKCFHLQPISLSAC